MRQWFLSRAFFVGSLAAMSAVAPAAERVDTGRVTQSPFPIPPPVTLDDRVEDPVRSPFPIPPPVTMDDRVEDPVRVAQSPFPIPPPVTIDDRVEDPVRVTQSPFPIPPPVRIRDGVAPVGPSARTAAG